MNKFLALCVVAVTVLVVQVQWTDALGNMFEDFVMFPSLRAKRDLETEEFFKDGNKHAAQTRAVNRQRRSNEENMSEEMKRVRKSLLEDDEEDAPFNCRAHELNDMKRATNKVSSDPVQYSWKTGTNECSTETKARFLEKYTEFGSSSSCSFTEVAEDAGHITISCANDGNYSPIAPFSPSFTSFNVEEYNGVAARNIIAHELLHACGIWHPHQEEGSRNLLEIDEDCILPAYLSQYTLADPSYTTAANGADMNEQSPLMYPNNAFLDPDCTVNILSKKKSLPSKAFGSYKSIYIHEVKKIRLSRDQSCEGEDDLESNEFWGGDCKVFTFAPTTVEKTELTVAGWTDVTTLVAEPGNTVQYECPGSNFQILVMKYGDIPNSGKCRGGAARVLTTTADEMDTKMFQCDGTGTDDEIQDVPTNHDLLMDASSMTSGSITVEVVCSD